MFTDPQANRARADSWGQSGSAFPPVTTLPTLTQMETLLHAAFDAFVATNRQGEVIAWNRRAEELFGWTREEALGRPMFEVAIPERFPGEHVGAMERMARGEPSALPGRPVERLARHRSGRRFHVEVSHGCGLDGDNWAAFAFIRDMTKIKRHEAQIEKQLSREAELTHRTLHDELTGLPNRRLVLDRISHAMARRSRSRAEMAVLFVDLDRFKAVNDSLGHGAGDRALRVVAERLLAAVRPSDTVARVAGDEFVIVCEEISERSDAHLVANRTLAALLKPIDVGGDQVTMGASIGIAYAHDSTAGAEDLLRDADAAMYRAKELGRGRIEVFDDCMRQRIRSRLRLERDLESCITRGELLLHYQPVINLQTDALAGVEALVRWQHPAYGLLYPSEFMSLAEYSGAVAEIDSWVIKEAAAQFKRWLTDGLNMVTVAINISERRLAQPSFVDNVRAVVADAGLAGISHPLAFDVTEAVSAKDPKLTARVLNELRDAQFGLAVDSFGVGMSSAAHLGTFPVHAIKMHRTVVVGVDLEPRRRTVIQSVINMAHGLGVRISATGVESAEQAGCLREMGCDFAQGDYFSPPLPPEELVTAVAKRVA